MLYKAFGLFLALGMVFLIPTAVSASEAPHPTARPSDVTPQPMPASAYQTPPANSTPSPIPSYVAKPVPTTAPDVAGAAPAVLSATTSTKHGPGTALATLINPTSWKGNTLIELALLVLGILAIGFVIWHRVSQHNRQYPRDKA